MNWPCGKGLNQLCNAVISSVSQPLYIILNYEREVEDQEEATHNENILYKYEKT